MTKKTEAPTKEVIAIKPPNFAYATFRVIGASPYVQHKFSQKARTAMVEKQKSGQQARTCGGRRGIAGMVRCGPVRRGPARIGRLGSVWHGLERPGKGWIGR